MLHAAQLLPGLEHTLRNCCMALSLLHILHNRLLEVVSHASHRRLYITTATPPTSLVTVPVGLQGTWSLRAVWRSFQSIVGQTAGPYYLRQASNASVD